MKPASSISVSPDLLKEANTLPIIKIQPNRANRAFNEVIRHSIVVKDELSFDSLYIQSHLALKYPPHTFQTLGFQWIARPFTDDLFLIDSPNPQWRTDILKDGSLLLGDVHFSVEVYDPICHDRGSEPIVVWIQIRGLPPRFWTDVEYRRLVEEMGGHLLTVDPRSSGHLDFRVLRLRVRVPDPDIIPKCRRMRFTDDDGTTWYYILTFEVEKAGMPIQGHSRPYW